MYQAYMKLRILIIDDDKYFRMALRDLLAPYGLCYEASSESEAINLIQREYFDIALIDMDIDSKKAGLNVLKYTKQKLIHSIILSSQTDESIIEESYLNGCNHFLAKLHYKKYLEPYIHKFRNSLEGKTLSDFFKTSYITQDKTLIEDISEISEINLKNKSVFITGETGVGKSLIGELLHNQTYSKEKPFIHINCSEIQENLMESELFGHIKGSFTGASSDKKGKLELANGGTLFLDEVATMPLKMQQKLLKAIDSHSFYPVGSDTVVHSEFTLITATCEDLFEKIHKELFRKDLFYRISGVNLHIKPLRERKKDIPLLTKFFLSRSPRRFIIKEDAVSLLKEQAWEGNIRELKKYIEILSTHKSGIISKEMINPSRGSISNESTSAFITNNQLDYIEQNGLRSFIKLIEEESIIKSMNKHQGKITHAIKELGISTSAFYRIFNNLKINI